LHELIINFQSFYLVVIYLLNLKRGAVRFFIPVFLVLNNWCMPEKTALVVGAGIVGLAMARALATNGYSVSVYERNFKASGASVRNFGMIWPIGQPAGKLYERAIRTRNCWKEIGISGKLWFDPVGSLHVAYHADEWIVLQELYEIFKNEGRKVKLFNKDQVVQISSVANKNNCFGGMFSEEEIIIDPREAIGFLPSYFETTLSVKFNWGKVVTEVRGGTVQVGSKTIHADLVFICSGSDFETLYPEEYAKFALTKCKLQMMRITEEVATRIGPAICGGLSLIHYASFKAAASLPELKARYEQEFSELLKWGIHVMISQNQSGQLTIGDSHEYGLSPDPFDRKHINDLILLYLNEFATLKNPRLIETWNGVYGKFTDGQTELFYSPEPDVFIVNGVGGAGMTLSFGFAEEKVNTL
jgi:FAD dependent oxidoreductase TIGR03364